MLLKLNLTLALAESVTAGQAAHKLAGYKGAGEVLLCSVVTYNEKMKTRLLGVPQALIKRFSAESRQVTNRMAAELRKLSKADICVAVTGLAATGASESKSKPVGTVFYAVNMDGKTFSLRQQFRGTPLEIRNRASRDLYLYILKVLKENL